LGINLRRAAHPEGRIAAPLTSPGERKTFNILNMKKHRPVKHTAPRTAEAKGMPEVGEREAT